MGIIEKLQNNFQRIVDDINPEYEVILRHKESKAIRTLRAKTRLKPTKVTLKYIIAAGCEYLKIPEESVYGSEKYPTQITTARIQLINCLLDLNFYMASKKQLSRDIHKDHSSIVYYQKKHLEYSSTDRKYVNTYNELKEYITRLISY